MSLPLRPSPVRRVLARAAIRATRSSPTPPTASTALIAMHRSPAEPKPELIAWSAARSRSASGSTTMWFLAPPRACTRLPCRGPGEPAAVQRGPAAAELDGLLAAGDLAEGGVEDLAVLGGDQRGQLGLAGVEQLAEAEQHRGALGQRGVPPAGKGRGRRGDRGVDLLDRGQRDLAGDLAGRRVGHRCGAAAGARAPGAADPVRNGGGHGRPFQVGVPQVPEVSGKCLPTSARIAASIRLPDSRAWSSQPNTQVVRTPSKPMPASAAKAASKSTSPRPISVCWCTRVELPGGLVM